MTEGRRPAAIESPCNRTCTIDPRSRLCFGCLRSLDEIAAWGRMTPDERQAIMTALPSRAPSLHGAPPKPGRSRAARP